MILIVHYYKSIVDGVMTSMIDLYNNLKFYRPDLDIDIAIVCPELFLLNKDASKTILYPYIDLRKIRYYRYLNECSFEIDETNAIESISENDNSLMITSGIPFMRFNKNFGDVLLHKKLYYLPTKFEADTIICSGRVLFEMTCDDVDLELKCNKMYVIDSLDILRSKLGIYPNLDIAVPTDDCTFLVNPANVRNSKYNQLIHYIKFSEKRLNSLQHTNQELQEVYNYRRTDKNKGEIYEEKYAENMGKSIFEHIYHGKTVNYYTDGLFMDDGLIYYLQLFGIDGSKNHEPLMITKEDIKKKLVVNFTDFIYRI